MPDRRPTRQKVETLEEQRAARKAAKRDEQLREQTKSEVEEHPYLDTEGGE